MVFVEGGWVGVLVKRRCILIVSYTIFYIILAHTSKVDNDNG